MTLFPNQWIFTKEIGEGLLVKRFTVFILTLFVSSALNASVCERSNAMRVVLEDQLSKDCKDISLNDLSTITELHFYESVLSETSSYFADLKSSDFKDLPNLRFLDLNWIYLENFPGDLFIEIPFLEKLHWGFGNLEAFDFKVDNPFRYLEKLKYLTLTNLKLKYIVPEIFSNLHNLEILSINHTDELPTKIHPKAFSQLKKLRVLRMLRPIKYSSKHINLFAENRNLEAIGLKFDPSSKFLPGGLFKELSNLKLLYLDSSGEPKISKYFFYGLKNLELLFLQEASFLQQMVPAHFSKMKKIKINFSGISFRYGASREVESLALKDKFPRHDICLEINSEGCGLEEVVKDVND